MRQATAANRGLNFNEAIERTTRALEWAPLKWQLYFARARKGRRKRPPADALNDFRRARFLEPNSYQVPFQEGLPGSRRSPPIYGMAGARGARGGTTRLRPHARFAAQHNPRSSKA
jgi:hypothetical protein